MFKSLGHPKPTASAAHLTAAGVIWRDAGRERRTPTWPASPQSHAFDLDDDLTKLVNIRTIPGGLEVEVRYGREVLLQQDRYTVRTDQPPELRVTKLGVTVLATRPILPGLAWPRWRLTYRF